MSTAKPGDIVSVVYDGFLSNNEIFESSKETGPLEFTIGTGQIMVDFEKEVIGMAKGESKTFTLPPEIAHGPHIPDLIHTLDRKSLKDQDIQVGTVLGLSIEKDGNPHQVPALVIEVKNDEVIVDFNHPLAGKSLTYKVTVQSIKNE
jgi:peptidylprolyl isomerase